MKKLLLSTLIAITGLLTTSCDNEKAITITDLPATAQTFLSTYWPNTTPAYITKEGVLGAEYDVMMTNGDEIGFEKSGEWDSVDCNRNEVPAGIVMDAIITDLATRYPGAIVTSIDKERTLFEVEILLSGGIVDLDLEYSFSGVFIRIDM